MSPQLSGLVSALLRSSLDICSLASVFWSDQSCATDYGCSDIEPHEAAVPGRLSL